MAGMESLHVSELIRRIENLLKLGTVAHVDVARARLRVVAGGLLSNWLPWLTLRAGNVRRWSAPSVGEQCLLLSPGGDLANGVALAGIFSEAIPQNDNRPHTHATHYPDGTVEEYDHDAHRHLLQCVGDILSTAQGTMTLKADGAIVIESGESITLRVGGSTLVLSSSGITVDPDLVAGGHVSVVNHVHGQVKGGTDKSGKPA